MFNHFLFRVLIVLVNLNGKLLQKKESFIKIIEQTYQQGDFCLDKEDEILVELKKISAALEKAPPPVAPKGFVNEFKDFLSKYKIFGLAVAFILALYAGTLIQALVKDFIIPLLGLIIPGMSDLASFSAKVLSQVFGVGDFLVALITLVIVALVVFVILNAAKNRHLE